MRLLPNTIMLYGGFALSLASVVLFTLRCWVLHRKTKRLNQMLDSEYGKQKK